MQIDVQEILRAMIPRGYELTRLADLAREIVTDDLKQLREVVEGLVSAGVVKKIKRGEFMAAVGIQQAVGPIRMKSKGFGFVEPIGGKPDCDIFVPRQSAGGALDGDVVLVTILPGQHRTRSGECAVGRVTAVLQRASDVVVGTLERSGNRYEVSPDMLKGPGKIRLVAPPPPDAGPGDKVVVQIDPEYCRFGNLGGRVIEVLGRTGDPFMEHRLVARHYGFTEEFPEEALRELEGAGEIEPPDAQDFRSHMVVTIDPEDARDYDDAVGLTLQANGGCVLEVHIADVARYVLPGTALDNEALRRSTSVYFPGMAIPMLPEKLSGNLCSLMPGRNRAVKSVFMEFSRSGELLSSRAVNGLIRSHRRLTYEEAQQIIDTPQDPLDPLCSMLRWMRDLAQKLRQRRAESGALEFETPEIRVKMDENGRITGTSLAKRVETHSLIEEFMLAANKTMAVFYAKHRLPFLRRVHEDPDPGKLSDFALFVHSMGLSLPKSPAKKNLQKLLASVRGTPLEHTVAISLLRCFKHAAYSDSSSGHYALGESQYMHFTSPIRRYPDLYSHQSLGAFFAGDRLKRDRSETQRVARWSSEAEVRAETAEREVTTMVALTYLEQFTGKVFEGFVSGADWTGLWVELEDIGVDGRVGINDMPPGHYVYEKVKQRMVDASSGAIYRLGQRVTVRILESKPYARMLDLELLPPRRKARASEAT